MDSLNPQAFSVGCSFATDGARSRSASRLGQVAPLVLLLWIVSAPTLAVADVVVLKNGDRVTGTISKMEDEQLEIDTDYAGKISIGWGNIQGLRSDRPLKLTFFASSPIPEGLGIREGDRVTVTGLDADGPIPLSDIKAVNVSDLYHRGNINLGGNVAHGNSSTQALNVAASYVLRQEWHRLQMDGKFNRGEGNGELTAQNGALSTKYDYLFTRQVFVSGQQLFENDRFQNLGLRSTTAVTLGYDIYDHHSSTLSLGAGPSLVYQDFTTSPGTVTPAVTWFVRWYQEFRGGDVILFHHHQGFQDFEHGEAFRLNADQGIRVKVYGDVALNFEYDVRFNTKPDPGRKTVDTTAIFGVSYSFGN
jgi:putative salt-induced outer membrane protein YdiY